MFTELNLAINWLENKKKKNKRTDLTRITNLAKLLGCYQLNYKIIHIAGTNGKGSTAMYINNMLLDLGYKVGLYTSPYIIKFNERICLNGEYIPDQDLLRLINFIYPHIVKYEEETDDLVPFFEILTLVALLYFKQEKVEYAIIECGIGGRLDATNFITPIASIITSIGYDHQNTLGNTLSEIAYQKAGIIKDNVPLFTIDNKEVNSIFLAESKLHHSKLFILPDLTSTAKLDLTTHFVVDNYEFYTPLLGVFQANNASLMIALTKYLFPNISNEQIQKSLSKAYIPARFELFSNYILDGAHNISAVKLLVKTLEELKLAHLTCIYASLKDKRYDLVLKELNKVVDFYVFPNFSDARQTDSNCYLPFIQDKSYKMVSSIEEAISLAKEPNTLITGSLHFVSTCRSILLKSSS